MVVQNRNLSICQTVDKDKTYFFITNDNLVLSLNYEEYHLIKNAQFIGAFKKTELHLVQSKIDDILHKRFMKKLSQKQR